VYGDCSLGIDDYVCVDARNTQPLTEALSQDLPALRVELPGILRDGRSCVDLLCRLASDSYAAQQKKISEQ